MKKLKKEIVVFTDGSSLGNPGAGGWASIVRADDQVVELGGHKEHTTNNQMELTAAIKALRFITSDLSYKNHTVVLYTDSSYMINGITKLIFGWQKNNWKTSTKEPVLNQDLWQELALLTKTIKVAWNHIRGHVGIFGNERVDQIATSMALKKKVNLYSGPYDTYFIDLDTVSSVTPKRKKSKSTPKGKAFSYLSLVSHKLEKHETWAECEARVKGVRGAKFKKAMNHSEEEEIKKSWGI